MVLSQVQLRGLEREACGALRDRLTEIGDLGAEGFGEFSRV
jgi:hypothetical protein